MSQRFITNTTSFIISSDESLNKPTLSSSQSTGSSGSNDNMSTGDSIHNNNQYFVSLNSVNTSMATNNQQQQQQKRLHSSVLPPPPPPPAYSSSVQGHIYGTSNGTNHSMGLITTANTTTTTTTDANSTIQAINSQHQNIYGHINLNLSQQCNGNTDLNSPNKIYSSYNQANVQQPNHTVDLRPNTQANPNQELYQIYSSGNNLTNSNSNSATNSPVINCQAINGTSQHNNETTYNSHIKHASTYSPKSNNSVQTFHQNTTNKQVNSNFQRTSINSLDSPGSNHLMPINVKGMLLHGVSGNDVIRNWLTSIECEEYLSNFIENGYDMPLITRMTPQDLTAIGFKSPILRKKLLVEIKKLNLDDDIPDCRPGSLERWLDLLKLSEYYVRLCDEGYDTIDRVCDLTWEDLEEIGIHKLGHQKRLLLGIERLRKYEKMREERQNDFAIYDVHPNHRVSLNQNSSENRLSTLGRSTVRSGFFQTRSGANLDHRGLPIATVVPALKHVNNSLANLDISHQVISNIDGTKTTTSSNGFGNENLSTIDQNQAPQANQISGDLEQNGLKMSDLSTTIKRNPPPLPPVRTNSLKIPQDNINYSNNIYGNNYGIIGANNNNHNTTQHYAPPMITGSTSFLRTPKLGTLTATTNKMLTMGGHIQSVNGQPTTMRSVPVREAPLPPVPVPAIPEKIDEEPPIALNGFSNIGEGVENDAIMNQPSIRHQLASADEFPPPPPSQ